MNTEDAKFEAAIEELKSLEARIAHAYYGKAQESIRELQQRRTELLASDPEVMAWALAQLEPKPKSKRVVA